MKRLILAAALVAAAITTTHGKPITDNRPQDCAEYGGEDEAESLSRGRAGFLKMMRHYDNLAKQGKLCGNDYFGDDHCDAKKRAKVSKNPYTGRPTP